VSAVVHSAQSPSSPEAARDEARRVIRAAGKPVGATIVVRELTARLGVDEPTGKRLWDKIRRDLGPDVDLVGRSYVWTGPPDPEQVLRAALAALEKLSAPRVSAARKRELSEMVRAGLGAMPVEEAEPARPVRPQEPVRAKDAEPGDGALPARVAELVQRCEDLERQLYAADTRSPEVRKAQERQLRIDAIRALAELAMEIEELTANEAEPAVMVEKVRAQATQAGLEPIGRAGEETTFDRSRHKPIGGAVRDGAPVYVVRPGYTWHAPDEDVLIGKAIVEE
jgi:hypothetical protein